VSILEHQVFFRHPISLLPLESAFFTHVRGDIKAARASCGPLDAPFDCGVSEVIIHARKRGSKRRTAACGGEGVEEKKCAAKGFKSVPACVGQTSGLSSVDTLTNMFVHPSHTI
jgi:hypothetical protein